ncbi:MULTISPECIES: hypothetical protein [Bradyrhizobium]|jgi:hypothetical protein|uniref:hypothetical protein n=1 Tax=Bradyrhizobium TaxID=374 RepID=UPI00039F126E|nr:hypothetical protein [Bradyrhizobium denitrificans]MCL8489362.1 hypothetical protein [Bradyrhizobium denitrificans]
MAISKWGDSEGREPAMVFVKIGRGKGTSARGISVDAAACDVMTFDIDMSGNTGFYLPYIDAVQMRERGQVTF